MKLFHNDQYLYVIVRAHDVNKKQMLVWMKTSDLNAMKANLLIATSAVPIYDNMHIHYFRSNNEYAVIVA